MEIFNLISVYSIRTIRCGGYDHSKNFKLFTSFRNSLTISTLCGYLLLNRKISFATGFVYRKRGKLEYFRHRPQKWEKVSSSSPNYPSIPEQANYAALSLVTSLVVFLLLEQLSWLVSLCYRLLMCKTTQNNRQDQFSLKRFHYWENVVLLINTYWYFACNKKLNLQNDYKNQHQTLGAYNSCNWVRLITD